MKPVERIIAAYEGKKTDKIPVDAWWSKEIYEKVCSEKGENPILYYGLDTRRFFMDIPLMKNEWGDLMGRKENIKIYSYPFPEVEMAETKENGVYTKIMEIKHAGYPAIGHIGSICFEVFHNITGMEKMFMAIYDKYDEVDEVCKKISGIKAKMALNMVEAGADIIHMGDDFGSQKGLLLSPDTWRQLFKPKIAGVIDLIKKKNKDCLVFFHSDGDISGIIGDFIEIGVDFLNPIQPECMDIVKISKRYCNDISFWGGIGTQDTFYRDRDHIFKTVKETIEVLGRTNRLVISPTHMMPGDIALENLDHFFKAVEYYGSI